jgi:hypothetical protein
VQSLRYHERGGYGTGYVRHHNGRDISRYGTCLGALASGVATNHEGEEGESVRFGAKVKIIHAQEVCEAFFLAKEVVRRRVLFCEDGAFRFANLGRGEELLNLIFLRIIACGRFAAMA